MTVGESRVRVSFNPSHSDKVTEIKIAAALLIDLINGLEGPAAVISKEGLTDMQEAAKMSEFFRLKALAMTDVESAALWAVKAATL